MKRQKLQHAEDAKLLRPDVVRRLYGVFVNYRIHGHVEGCPCCVGAQSEALLSAKPLESLDSDILQDYLWSAMWTWGSETDFKHFLPRILELSLENEIATSLLAQKLDYAKWQSWPQEEVEVIHEFFIYAWRRGLEAQDKSQLINWFEPLSTLGEPIGNYLLEWLNSESEYMRFQFAEWLVEGGWKDRKIAVPVNLFTASTVEKLEAQFFEDPESVYAPTFAAAADIARNMMVWNSQKL